METGKIIEKICKCLRLGESCNPNEAAAAMRQAHGLMKKYGISEQQVLTGHVSESSVASGLKHKPPFWTLALSNIVADSFGCRAYVARKSGQNADFRFIGLGHAAAVSGYTFKVLHRHLKKARRQFIQQLKLDDKTEKTRRGDVFAQAWLFRIAQLVADFADMEQNSAIVEDYVKQNYGEPMEMNTTAKTTDEPDYNDILSGMRAATGVDLYRPMEEQKQYALAK